MVNYSNGKIYKIECTGEQNDGEIYIGSTTKQYLSQRLDLHRRCYKSWKKGNCSYVTAYQIFDKYGVGNCDIVLLENANVSSKDELRAREGFYTKTIKCVNKRIECRTQKEYRSEHKEEAKSYMKQYLEENKAELKVKSELYRSINKEKLAGKKQEYINKNKLMLSEKSKQYYIKNRGRMLKQSKIKYHCDACNCDFDKNKLGRHEASNGHKHYEENKIYFIIRKGLDLINKLDNIL